jgi:hypothetical protein
MNVQEEITDEIRQLCNGAELLPLQGVHFVYNDKHMMYLPESDGKAIRICIPHLANSNDYKEKDMTILVNETNREVKFIKVFILRNGSISLNYDHQLMEGERVKDIIVSMIRSLNFASDYLLRKMSGLARREK